jgi:molybdate transport system substrate-binding protein
MIEEDLMHVKARIAVGKFRAPRTPMGVRRRVLTALAALAVALPAALTVGGALYGAPAAAANGTELHVAVAANFLGTLQKLAVPYRQATGNTLSISSGSTGQLYTQIKQGAPFDVFFSADTDRPHRLESQGLTVAGSRFTYAVGTLVLWSPRAGLIDPEAHVLTSGSFQRLSIADPKAAPYGAAAQQVLTALGLWDRLNQQRRLVVGQSITQAWQFAASGNATLAFVALSQVIGPGGHIRGSSWSPPQSLYSPIDQDAVVLKRTGQPAAAQSLERWLRSSPEAARILRAAGYHSSG